MSWSTCSEPDAEPGSRDSNDEDSHMETAAQNPIPEPLRDQQQQQSHLGALRSHPTPRPSVSASTLEQDPQGTQMSLQMGKRPGQQDKQNELSHDR